MEINNLTVKYESFVVLHDFSSSISDGEVTCILGESGIGKTTLLKVLMGLVQTESGELSGIPNKKAVVFQENRLLDEFSAVQNIQIANQNKLSEEEIINALREIGMTENINKPVSSLSGGMARRCAIVRAMLSDAELILMDEPFQGLDPENANKVIDFIKKHHRQRTIVIVLHSLELARLLTNQVIYMK